MSAALQAAIAKKSVRAQIALAHREENEANKLKTLLAMAEGLRQKPPMDPQLCELSKPTKKHLYKEAMRRFHHMQIPLDEAPATRWSKAKLEEWLQQYPVTDRECVAVLRSELMIHFGDYQDAVDVASSQVDTDPSPLEDQMANEQDNNSQVARLSMNHDPSNLGHPNNPTPNNLNHADIAFVSGNPSFAMPMARFIFGNMHGQIANAAPREDGGNRRKRVLEVPEQTRKDPPIRSQHFKRNKPNYDDVFEEALLKYHKTKCQRGEDLQANNRLNQALGNWLQRKQITEPECVAFLWNDLSSHFGVVSFPAALTAPTPAAQLPVIDEQTIVDRDDPKFHWAAAAAAAGEEKDIPKRQQDQDNEPLGKEQTDKVEDKMATNSMQDNSTDSFDPSDASIALLSLRKASQHLSHPIPLSNTPTGLSKKRLNRQNQQHSRNEAEYIRADLSKTSIPLDSASQFSPLISFTSVSPPKKLTEAMKSMGNSSDHSKIREPLGTCAFPITTGIDNQSDNNDDTKKVSGDTNASSSKKVAWNASNEVNWWIKVLMTSTDDPTTKSRVEVSKALDKIAFYCSKETERVAQVLVANGGVERLLTHGRNDQNNAAVLERILALLGTITSDQLEAKQQIVSLDGIRWLLDVSQQYKSDVSIQDNAFLTLGNVTSCQPEARRQIMALDGISWLLDVSQRYKDSISIQCNTFLALGSISYGQPEAKQQIVTLDGIRWLLNVSRQHQDNADIQQCAIFALGNISCGQSEAKQQIVSLDGIRWLLDVSRQYENNDKVQRYSFGTLANIASSEPEARQQIVSLDGIPWLLDMSQHYKRNVKIQRNAFLALGQIASFNTQARQQILTSLNAISSVWGTLQEHKRHAWLQLYGCFYLAVMFFHEEEARCQVRSDINSVIEFVLSMSPQLENSMDSQHVASQCLSTMKAYKDDKQRKKTRGAEMVRIWIAEVVERLRLSSYSRY